MCIYVASSTYNKIMKILYSEVGSKATVSYII